MKSAAVQTAAPINAPTPAATTAGAARAVAHADEAQNERIETAATSALADLDDLRRRVVRAVLTLAHDAPAADDLRVALEVIEAAQVRLENLRAEVA